FGLESGRYGKRNILDREQSAQLALNYCPGLPLDHLRSGCRRGIRLRNENDSAGKSRRTKPLFVDIATRLGRRRGGLGGGVRYRRERLDARRQVSNGQNDISLESLLQFGLYRYALRFAGSEVDAVEDPRRVPASCLDLAQMRDLRANQ